MAVALQVVAAIAAGAVVGYVTQRLAFRDARRLAADERAAASAAAALAAADHRGSLLRALRDEVEANLRLVTRPDQSHLGQMSRSGWDDARALELPEALRAQLRVAYNEAAIWNGAVARVDMLEANNVSFSVGGVRTQLASQEAQRVHTEFDRARVELLSLIQSEKPPPPKL